MIWVLPRRVQLCALLSPVSYQGALMAHQAAWRSRTGELTPGHVPSLLDANMTPGPRTGLQLCP